jgi:hypothetical protein
MALCNFIRKRQFSWLNLWILVVIVFTFSYVIITGVIAYNTVRYLIILLPLTGFLAATSVGVLQKKLGRHFQLVIILIVLATLFNTITAATTIVANSHNQDPNSLDYAIVKELRINDVNNAYADYWLANMSYYLSDYQDNVLPTWCYRSEIYKDPVLLDAKRFNVASTKTGLIVSPDLVVPISSPYPQSLSCSLSATIKQFGRPDKIVKLSSSASLLVYNHKLPIPWRKY